MELSVKEYCENAKRNTACCFTGHRNRDLPFGGDLRKQGMKCLVSSLQMLITEAVHDGYDTFISGMSDGVDLICAQLVLDIARSGRFGSIRLVCALPYADQYREIGSPLDKYKYSMILKDCDIKVVISNAADRDRYKLRNQFMVDNSSRIIGLLKEKKSGSGTLQTVNMAKRAGIEMKIISADRNPQLYIDTAAVPAADKLTLIDSPNLSSL